jgi:cyanophycin synthetase
MLPHESRRLTGCNLLSDRPGAVLDVYYGDVDGAGAEATIAAWRSQARRLLDAVGWRGEELYVRRFRSGASLALSAPIDALYTATEINEQAWAAAVDTLGTTAAAGNRGTAAGDPGAPIAAGDAGTAAAFEAAADRLRAAVERERNPALLALRDAAAAHGVAFFSDDEEATVGLGSGARTWPLQELPPPRAVDWAAVHDIPVALVTGTNGKTTTVRLTAAILAASGRTVGTTTTDGIEVGGEAIDLGDYSGPGGARTLLRDRRVEAAVLETARGGLLRRGLAICRVAAAAVTNVAADHLGAYGVEDLAGLAETKLVVTRAVAPHGRAVLNADDPEVAARGSRGTAPVTWFTLDARRARRTAAAGLVSLEDHLAAGGDAVLLDGDELVLARGAGGRQTVAALSGLPIAFGGAACYNVANALAAIGLAAALGAPAEAMAAGLAALRNDDAAGNPGRGFLMELDGFRALVDYAHNPHGLAAVIGFAAGLPAIRRLLVLGQAGDRDDDALRALARAAWALRPDRVILKELPAMLRGRLPGEVPAILEAELLRCGLALEQLGHAATEVEAVRQALAWARPGDLLLLLVHKQRDEAMALLNQRRSGWI